MTYGRRSSRAGTGYVCNGWKADTSDDGRNRIYTLLLGHHRTLRCKIRWLRRSCAPACKELLNASILL